MLSLDRIFSLSLTVLAISGFTGVYFLVRGLARVFLRLRRSRSSQGEAQSLTTRAFLATVVGAVASVVAAYAILGRGGLLERLARVDLSYLLLAVIAPAVAVVASAAVRRFLPRGGQWRATTDRPNERFWRSVVPSALDGLAWVVVAYVLFGEARLFVRGLAPRGGSLRAYLPPFGAAVPWLEAYVVGITAYRAWAILGLASASAELAPEGAVTPRRWYEALVKRSGDVAVAMNVAVIAALLVYLLLNPAGVVLLLIGLPLSGVAPFLYGSIVILLAARLTKVVIPWMGTPALSTFLAWAALAEAAFGVMHELRPLGIAMAVDPYYRSVGAASLPYLTVTSHVAGWGAALLGAWALLRAVPRLPVRWVSLDVLPAVNAALLFAGGVIAWAGMAHLTAMGQVFNGLGAMAFGACAGVALGYAARYALDSTQTLVADSARWLAASHFRNANIGAFCALYPEFVRPSLYATFAYAPLIEGLGVAVLGLYCLRHPWARLAPEMRGAAPSEAWLSWTRHSQTMNTASDPFFDDVVDTERRYVNSGDREPFLVRTALALWDANLPLNEIVVALHPLIEQLEVPPPSLVETISRLVGAGGASFDDRKVQQRLATQLALTTTVGAAAKEITSAGVVGASTRAVSVASRETWERAAVFFVYRGDRDTLVALTIGRFRDGATGGRAQLEQVLNYRNTRLRWYTPPWRRNGLPEFDRRRRQAAAASAVEWGLRPAPATTRRDPGTLEPVVEH